MTRANDVSQRAAELLEAGWPECDRAWQRLEAFDSWLRHPANRFNPGTTADLVTAALYAAIRDGTVDGAGGNFPYKAIGCAF